MPCPPEMKLKLTKRQAALVHDAVEVGVEEVVVALFPDQADHVLRRLLRLLENHAHAERERLAQKGFVGYGGVLMYDELALSCHKVVWHNPEATFRKAWPDGISNRNVHVTGPRLKPPEGGDRAED